MDVECTCGHGGSRHREEQPYPCYECDCRAFRPAAPAPRPAAPPCPWKPPFKAVSKINVVDATGVRVTREAPDAADAIAYALNTVYGGTSDAV